ncbi:MAG: hypothetical protein KatS3mg057_1418 [Herpetosiphonaceae bacterium]|nr:MAG: hypothetical protein KatS3mg057_1418 [Herpetosiphonaceae bacterium]
MSNAGPEEYVLVAPPKSPLGALRALKRALRQLYDNFFLFTILGALLYLTLPTVILPGVVVATIYQIARQAQNQPAPAFSDLLPALRAALPWGPLLFLSGLVGLVLLLFNIQFYGATETLALLQPLWMLLLILWLSIGFYSFAIAVALDWPGIRAVVRIAFLFVAARPFTTLTVWLGVPLLIAIALVLPLLLFLLPGLLALWATTLTYPPIVEESLAED